MVINASDIDPLFLRPTIMDVDLSALTENYRAIRQRIGGAKLMCVLKANAYGHGLIECARHFESLGAEYFGVALVEEGIELRRAGIGLPILVFGGIVGSQVRLFIDHDLEIAASSLFKLEAVESTARALNKRARVHLKIDTGMERLGVHSYSAAPLLEAALRCEWVDVVGIFSHFANADSADPQPTQEQLSAFLETVSFYQKRGLNYPIRHIANSAAVLQYPETALDMVRCGIALYGIYPHQRLASSLLLRPAMSLRSKVVYFKVVRAGAGVSYGHTWRATHDTRVVTVPIGYGDGLPRRLSNRGAVLIRGCRYPMIGNICMDQVMVNIGQAEAYNGDDVVLIGSQGSNSITVNELAELCETIPYEILTATNVRVPRRYVNARYFSSVV